MAAVAFLWNWKGAGAQKSLITLRAVSYAAGMQKRAGRGQGVATTVNFFSTFFSVQRNFLLEFDKVWVHGLLHLIGYDHVKNKDYFKMNKIEKKFLIQLIKYKDLT